MTRGRKPQPVHLKLVTGNPGRRPVSKPRKRRDPENVPRMPKGTRKEIALIWRRMIRSVPDHLLKTVDSDLLYSWCWCKFQFEEAERKLHASSMLIKTPNGMPTQSPYIAVCNRMIKNMRELAADLGFTPVARARLGSEDDAEARDEEESGYFD